MKTKLCKPILIEDITEESLHSDRMYLISVNNRLYNPFENSYYQLALVSIDPNEKIKIGDRVIYQMNDGHITDLIVDNTINTYPERWQGFKKVMAAQSRISPEYTNQFVEEFNKNEIKDVDIEMEEITEPIQDGDWSKYTQYKPKLTNDFITIIKEESILYTEEEVEELIEKIRYPFDYVRRQEIKKLFEENRKR